MNYIALVVLKLSNFLTKISWGGDGGGGGRRHTPNLLRRSMDATHCWILFWVGFLEKLLNKAQVISSALYALQKPNYYNWFSGTQAIVCQDQQQNHAVPTIGKFELLVSSQNQTSYMVFDKLLVIILTSIDSTNTC